MTDTIKRSLAVKTLALLLAVGLLVTGVLLVGCSVVAMGFSGTAGTTEVARQRVAESVLYRYAMDMARKLVWEFPLEEYEAMPFTYTAVNDAGELLASTYQGGAYLAKSTATYMYDYYPYSDSDISVLRQVSVTLYADPDQSGEGWLPLAVQCVTTWHTYRWLLLCLGGVALLVVVGLLVFLHAAAGWRQGQLQPQCNLFDRIPFDLYTGLYVLIGVLEIWVLAECFWYWTLPAVLLTAGFGVVDLFLLLGYTMSIATRLKTRTLWHNTLVGRLLRLLGRGMAAVGRHLPLLWKVLLGIGVFSVAEFLVMVYAHWELDVMLAWWFVGKLLLVPLLLLLALGLGRLQEGIRRIAGGQVEHQIATQYLLGDLRRTAEDINHIGDGLSDAVEARLKSERFKTELITNVSHDIKTPLTSIINYVDLMEKQQPEDPVLQEYLEVLHRQSARLKKLIEDLIEASKASTGNLSVERAPCQLGVLLEQAVGEYTEKAELGRLTLLLSQPEQPVTVLADGRHLWRVFDNLLNNICKYAQPDTRVYLDLAAEGGHARITFRNISRTPLHITGEELLERFVRGDSARHTEGSGLGLSIARSLIELQGGTLQLAVDGDLFKVDITLPMEKK